MNIQKYAGGRWRLRENKNGKTYSTYLDHKPTKAEAREILDQMEQSADILGPNAGKTFSEAYQGYIDAKLSVLSPSTLRGYKTSYKGLPEWFTSMPIANIKKPHVQKLVNDYSVDHSPKTVRNQHGLVSAVLKFYDIPNMSVTLPQAQKEDVYIPSKEDVANLLKAASGTKYEVALRLGLYGLRRSEVMALSCEDLSDDNILTINKALVEGVLKETKTKDSTRKIPIDQELADMIRQQGYVYDGSESRLSMAVTMIEEKAGIPHFSLHKLRHFYASYLHELGYTDAQIQELGGWSTDHVMKRVYRHALDMDLAKKQMAEDIGKLMNGGN